ncbi:MAG: protein-disulfide reductase DsbD family protein [Alphaproteobacteria bacterium]|nr:protein-disulfide reductase DsbD family protein [Alphaproteobacteria bacterium]MDD9919656.1 protein-disulfide reductase DsbD family protein [Alphaproteobacteria bacterium]
MFNYYARSLFILLALFVGSYANAFSVRVEAVETQLVSSHVVIQPNQTFQISWHLNMDEGWHVYWKNPGDTGLPAEITWHLPQGFQTSPPTWPIPHPIPTPPVMSYGYEKPINLITTVAAPADLPLNETITIKADVAFLMCKDVCLPGQASLQTDVLTGSQAQPNPQVTRYFETTLPKPAPIEHIKLLANDTHYQIVFPPHIKPVRFLPEKDGWIEDLEQPTRTQTTLTIKKDTWSDAAPNQLSGLLWVNEEEAYAIEDISVSGVLQATPFQKDQPNLTLWLAIALAFLAGLILNLMPCVLPVLALKVFSLIKQAHGKTAPLALAYTLGTIGSFWALGGTLLALRYSGQQLGWGFQFQSPAFVAFLTLAMALVTLSFYDVFRLPSLFGNTEQKLANQANLRSAFFSGALVTLVATPCTVPFMGAATTFALTSYTVETLAIFTAMGIGLALPFLVFSLFPPLTRWLPQPGLWMVTFKFFVGLPIFGTTLWLLWLLKRLSDLPAFIFEVGAVATAFIILKAAFPRLLQRRWRSTFTIFIAASLIIFSWYIRPTSNHNTIWQPWSVSAFEKALANNQPVILDVTADWCITCKVTEATVLASQEFLDLAKQHNVALLQADWTHQNTEITELLASYNRHGVPLYIVQKPSGKPQILPQFPNVDDFKKALENPSN